MNHPSVRAPETHATTLDVLVTRAATLWPERVALIDDRETLSWASADDAVAAMAELIDDRGVRRGDVVLLSVPKSIDAWLAVHALLRVGAVVVPVDPRVPGQVADAIARRSQAVAMITTVSIRRRRIDAAHRWSTIIDLETLATARAGEPSEPSGRFRPGIVHGAETASPDDPAYVIFTSGSTGEPKGIVHSHRSALAYAELAARAHDISVDDRLAGLPPLHFDMSTLELYAAPLTGASVAPVRDAVLRFPSSVVKHSLVHDVTVWYAVPTLLASLVDRGGLADEPLPRLRLVIYAGEPYGAAALRSLFAALPGAEIHNAYGPAETNVVSVHRLSGPPADDEPVPIGWPWSGARFDVRDGELWVAATTLMTSYLGRPDLTAERMVEGDDHTVWYRTGDLVDMSRHGYVFRGRIDRQVKVRGVRLELDAIEAAIEQVDGVLAAVVAPMPAEQADHVVASVLVRGNTMSIADTVRRFAAETLPSVAVPTAVTVVDQMPTTQSGKVDRGAERRRLQEPPHQSRFAGASKCQS